MSGQRQARTPVLLIAGDQFPAELREALGRAEPRVGEREAVEGEVRPLRCLVDRLFPDPGGLRHPVVAGMDVAEIQIGGNDTRVEIDRRLKARDRSGVVSTGNGLEAELVLEECENGLTAAVLGAPLTSERSPDVIGLLPLMLILVQLLDVQQRVLVVRIDPDDLVERFEGAIDKPPTLEVETEAEEDVRLLEASQARALQQALMNVDRARHLPLLAIQTTKQQMDFECVSETL